MEYSPLEYIRNVDIKKADNGYIVCYDKKDQPRTSNTMEHVGYSQHKKLFTGKEKEAWDYFLEKKKIEVEQKKHDYMY